MKTLSFCLVFLFGAGAVAEESEKAKLVVMPLQSSGLSADWMEKDAAVRKKVRRGLDRFLVHKIDREVFGLRIRDDDTGEPTLVDRSA